MPTFELTGPDGKKYRLTPPANATQEEIDTGIKQFIAGHSAAPSETPGWHVPFPTGKFPEPAMKGGIPTLPGIPPGIGGQALVAGEEFVAKPAAITAGITAGGALGGPVGAAAGGAAAGAGSEALFEEFNRAMGFQPEPLTPMRLGLSALGGAAPPVLEKVGGSLAKRVAGLTAREKAAQKAKDIAATAIPEMQDEVERAGQLKVRSVFRARDAHEKALNREINRVRQEARVALGTEEDAALRGYTETSPQAVAQRRAQQGLDPGYGAAYNEATVGTIRDVQRAGQEKFGAEYAKLYDPYKDVPLPPEIPTSLSENAQQMLQDAESFKTIDPGLRKLVNRVRGPSPEEIAAAQEKAMNAVTGGRPFEAFGASAQAQLKERFASEMEKELGKSKVAKVGDLLQIQADAAKYMNNPNGPTRHVAAELRSRMLDALDAAGVVRDPDLNARYRMWRKMWDWPTLRQLHEAVGPVDLGKVFQPETLASLVPYMKPGQKELVKATLADWAVANKKSLSDLAEIVPANTAKALGWPDVSRWHQFDAKAAANILATQQTPALRSAMERGIAQAEKLAKDEFGWRVKRSSLKMLDSMGPFTQPLRRVVATLNPAEATEFYNTIINHPEMLDAMVASARNFTWEQPRGVWGLFKHHAPYLGFVAIGETLRSAYYGGGGLSGYVAGALPAVFGAEALNQIRDMSLRALSRSGALTKLETLLASPPTPSKARQIGKLIGRFATLEAIRYPAASQKVQSVRLRPEPLPVPPPLSPTPLPGQPTASALPPAP